DPPQPARAAARGRAEVASGRGGRNATVSPPRLMDRQRSNSRPSRAAQAHRSSTTVLSILMVVIGLALLVRTLAAGGGALATGVFFQLTAMTYAEGASMHPERGGAAVFARYAFNELISFVAGWAILLDYVILVAITALTVPSYLAAFWGSLGHGALQILVACVVIAIVSAD